MTDVLTVNVGSSSVKLVLVDPAGAVVDERQLPAPDESLHAQLADAISSLPAADAVGHRVVHGGTRFTRPTRIDQDVRDGIADLVDLAPLHQGAALLAIDAMAKLLPDLPAVACFDTAFHSTLPAAAYTYAIPTEWRERYGLRRYGFHGLSHEYAAQRAAGLAQRPAEELRIVSCHLGAGASLAAISGGVSVDTTMGFTPLEGLVMATRSGSVDPGVLLWLLRHTDIDAATLEDALEHHGGLAGLAGDADMRAIESGAADGDANAILARAVYLHRLRGGIAAMAAAMGGVDAIVFTGGVGEHSAAIRADAVAELGFLGATVDADRNAPVESDREISLPSSTTRVFVVSAREDAVIAAQTRQLVG